MAFLKTVILLIVCFSCNVKSEIDKIPKLPSAKIDEIGNIEWNVTPRIVGGTPAAAGEFLGKISIQTTSNQHFCGGTLIHASHVLTAAHCVTTEFGAVINPSIYQLVGDDLTLSPVAATRQTRSASHVFVHPQYNIEYLLNDIAIIRVNQPFTPSATFSPVLRAASTPANGFSCSVAGWGALFYNGGVSNTLQRVNATIIDRSICNGASSYSGLVAAGMLCAGNMTGGQDACQGDSGGGLICENYVAGIVSWGYECARPLYPGVYTDVSVYNAWIDSQIVWNLGNHENVPTPTTINPNSVAASILISINLIVSSFFMVMASM